MKKKILFISIVLIVAILAIIFIPTKNTDIVKNPFSGNLSEPTYFTGENLGEPIYFRIAKTIKGIPFGTSVLVNGNQEEIMEQEEVLVENNQPLFNFESTLFIGDSIFVGLEKYIKETNNKTMAPSVFFANGGFAIRHNRQKVNSSSTHPELNGEKMKISKAVKTTDKDNLFIMMGTNDLVVNTPSTAKNDFATLMGAILDVNPGMNVYILETVVPVNGKNNQDLTCENAKEYNKLLKFYAEDKNYNFIELPDILFDDNGCLKEEYSTDGFLHLNDNAYKLIVDSLMYVE